MKKIIALSFIVSTLSFSSMDKYYIPNAHSHNDYEQEYPLFLALKNGISSIEADVWLRTDVNGKQNLFVAHDEEDISPDRTLEKMYLEPLAEIVRSNNGVVYNNKDEKVYLHVDLKTTNKETWNFLQEILEDYKDVFTQYYPDGTIKKGAVTIFTNEDFGDYNFVKYSTGDGRFGNIYNEKNWENYFTNSGVTPIVSSGLWSYNDPTKSFDFENEILYKKIIEEFNLSIKESDKLSDINRENASIALSKNYTLLYKYLIENKVEFSDYFKKQLILANEIGDKHDVLIRFWNSPDNIKMWELLKPLNNVMINTGNIQELKEFILEK